MILGVVLAGGMSSRFGSDKALAEYKGQSLLSHAVDTLSGWCDYVVIAGRETGPAPCIPDWPQPGLGPMGGIAAGLRFAADGGYDSVISCSVDGLGLPENLLELLSPPSAYLASQPVIGHWKTNAASIAEAILQSEGRRSMFAFATAANARPVQTAFQPANINTPADLAAMERDDGI